MISFIIAINIHVHAVSDYDGEAWQPIQLPSKSWEAHISRPTPTLYNKRRKPEFIIHDRYQTYWIKKVEEVENP